MADKAPTPDWGIVGTAVGVVITAVGGAIALVRRGSPAAPTPLTGADRTEQTLDAVFRLVEQLQEERDRLEVRATELLREISELRSKIAALESQVRMLSWPPSAHPPANLE